MNINDDMKVELLVNEEYWKHWKLKKKIHELIKYDEKKRGGVTCEKVVFFFHQ